MCVARFALNVEYEIVLKHTRQNSGWALIKKPVVQIAVSGLCRPSPLLGFARASGQAFLRSKGSSVLADKHFGALGAHLWWRAFILTLLIPIRVSGQALWRSQR